MALLDAADRPSPLAHQLEAKTRDLDWTLAHFTFVANVTALAAACDIAHSPAMSVASCRALPGLGLAFVGDSADLLATYATFLADPGSQVSLIVNESQRQVVERAFDVESVVPRWQMLYRGDAADPASHEVSELVENDFPAVQALAKTENVPLRLCAEDPLKQGPAFGIWERRKLIAAGMTSVCLPGAAQIDNVVTRKEYRMQGYGSAVVAALLRAHLGHGRQVFVLIDQDNEAAIHMLEKLGFTRERAMYAMACVLKDPLT